MIFNDLLSFLKFDMESRGIRLDKEDNMTIDGAILTADSHGDKFQCNSPPIYTYTYFIQGLRLGC